MELRATYTLFAEGCRGIADQAADASASTCATASTRRPTASASRSCGRSRRRVTSPGLVVHTHRLADGPRHLWRLFPLHCGREPGVASASSSASTTANPWLSPFEEFQRFKTHPAMREASRAASASPTARARSTRAASSPCRSWLPRRRADRRHRRLPERAEDQGHAYRDEVRHAGGRGGRRGARPGDAPGGTRQLPRSAEGRAGSRPNCRASATSARASPSSACGAGCSMPGSTPMSSAARRPGPCDHHADHDDVEAGVRVPADRLPEARRRADLRPALLGIPVEHQP